MKNQQQAGTRVDRRTTIKWLAATMVAAGSGCSSNGHFVGEEIPPATSTDGALLGIARATGSAGYGTDPDLMNPVTPWPRTMTPAQLETTSALCDLMLPEDEKSPAASAVGVPDFIDEWISAPYEQQQHDRQKILFGLEWLEQRSRERFNESFASVGEIQASELLDDITNSDQRSSEQPELVDVFDRFRFLSVGAFYTTAEGMDDIGYVGNVPISGDYPGPSPEALEHLAGVLKKLDLSLPAQSNSS